jgi:hypothetical protein
MSCDLPTPIDAPRKRRSRPPGTLLAALDLAMRGPQWRRIRHRKPGKSLVRKVLKRMRRAA